jgi:uncharacterized protein YprB with RNaseH-like and TPR domain
MQSVHEYEVVRDGNIFGSSLSNNIVFASEYHEARRQMASLLARYEGVSFDSAFTGREISNEGGICYACESQLDLSRPLIDIDRFRKKILTDLTLVKGIGAATEKKLNARGFATLADLLAHPKFREGTRDVLDCISGASTLEIMECIGRRHAKSDTSILGAACMHEPEDFVFLDIETLGLFSRPIILFGVGTVEGHGLCVRQYLLRDISEELPALMATVEHLSRDNPALVTFNGKSFDLPYITDRLAYYGMASPGRIPHFDALHFSRRRWKATLPTLRLTALEREILGIRREDDIPGQMVPEFYAEYIRTGNIGPLVPIVEHNRQDVHSLALLFFHLLEESYGCS